MSLNKNLYNLMSVSEASAKSNTGDMDFVLNLEILDQCAHHCDGCFVQRKNTDSQINLETALEFVQAMDDKHLRFREVILSPTDMFSAVNTLDVLTDSTFQMMMQIHPKTRITTTAIFENMNWDNFKAVFDVLDDPALYRENMIMEFLVPIDVDKVLSRDQKYLDDHKKVFEFFDNETPKEIDWSFVINVQHHPSFADNIDELTKIVKEEFNTIIEFLPSFFRTNNKDRIAAYLKSWKNLLSESVNEHNYKDIMLTIADKNHNSFNTLVINYKKGDMYISPFIYEQIMSEYSELKLDTNTAQDAFDLNNQLIVNQFKYVNRTDECSGCEFLSACIGRNVLSFMEINDVKHCIYPKDVLGYYSNHKITIPRIQRCK